jgi:hypothetical protein
MLSDVKKTMPIVRRVPRSGIVALLTTLALSPIFSHSATATSACINKSWLKTASGMALDRYGFGEKWFSSQWSPFRATSNSAPDNFEILSVARKGQYGVITLNDYRSLIASGDEIVVLPYEVVVEVDIKRSQQLRGLLISDLNQKSLVNKRTSGLRSGLSLLASIGVGTGGLGVDKALSKVTTKLIGELEFDLAAEGFAAGGLYVALEPPGKLVRNYYLVKGATEGEVYLGRIVEYTYEINGKNMRATLWEVRFPVCVLYPGSFKS